MFTSTYVKQATFYLYGNNNVNFCGNFINVIVH